MNRPRTALVPFAAGALAAGLLGGAPAPASALSSAQPSPADAAYLAFAARANLTEIAQGRLAKQNAADPEVREFGRQMVRDHRKQLRALEAVAASVGVSLPSRPDKQQRQVTRAWSTLEGRAFDCAYVPFQWGDHQLVIAATQAEAAAGTDPAVRQAAAAALPVLVEHYEHVTMLVGDLGRCR